MRRLSIVFLILLAWPVTGARAEKRVALVVGNATYQNVGPLDNAGNDATLIAETLRGVGFTLIGNKAQLNLDKTAFDNAIQAFGRSLMGADVALFYYAGHGVQVRGSNYLVPVTANPVREADVDFQMVDVALVLKQMEGTKLNIVVLDACRNNPFIGRGLRSGGGGLAQISAPEGTILSYATQPGNIALDGDGKNSPYSAALAEAIRKPDVEILQTFNQVGVSVKKATSGQQQPWVSSSPIDGMFYFAGRSDPRPGDDNRVVERPPQQQQQQTPPPVTVPPPRTAAIPPALEQRALAFVTNDMVQSQASNAAYLDYARQAIDEQVDYYGKITSRAEVLKDKERYVARWPVRSYQMRPDTIRTSCVEGSSTCRVDGLLDYSLSNPSTGKKSSGSATFEFGIRFGANGGRITYENGKTLSPQR